MNRPRLYRNHRDATKCTEQTERNVHQMHQDAQNRRSKTFRQMHQDAHNRERKNSFTADSGKERKTHLGLLLLLAGSLRELLELLGGIEPLLDLLALGFGHEVEDLLGRGRVEHGHGERHVVLALAEQRRQLPVNLPQNAPEVHEEGGVSPMGRWSGEGEVFSRQRPPDC